MLQVAKDNGLPNQYWKHLHITVYDHINVLRAGFLSRHPARIPPLHTDLTKEAAQFKCNLHKYSLEQRRVLSATVKNWGPMTLHTAIQ